MSEELDRALTELVLELAELVKKMDSRLLQLLEEE